MEYKKQRCCTCQSRLKTRNSFVILLFASLTGTSRSTVYDQTIFAGYVSQRPLFQIFNWTIICEDGVRNAKMVHMPVTIENSKFVRHSAVCIVDRYVSFDGLRSNNLRWLRVSTSVVSDFQLDDYLRRWSTKCQDGAHASHD